MDTEAFRTEAATHVIGLLGRLDLFLNVADESFNFAMMKSQVYGIAAHYAVLLEDPAQQDAAAHNLCSAMFGDDTPPLAFWATEVGRAVGLAIGYPRPVMDRTTAKAILGFSRQRVFELITDGKLETTEDGKYVTARSVRDRLRLKVSGAPEASA